MAHIGRNRTQVVVALVAVLLLSSCASIVMRHNQASVIGDLQPGTPRAVLIANSEGQVFAIPRTSISHVRPGGQRMLLWSLLAGSGFLILGPIGAVQWAMDVGRLDAMDSTVRGYITVVDDEEVIVPQEVLR